MYHQVIRGFKELLRSSLGIVLLSLVLILGCLKIASGAAIEEVKGAETLSHVHVDKLVKSLEDPKEREELINKIKALSQLEQPAHEDNKGLVEHFVALITAAAIRVTEKSMAAIPLVGRILAQYSAFFEKFAAHHMQGMVGLCVILLLAFVAGLCVEGVTCWILRGVRSRVLGTKARSMAGKHSFMLVNIVVSLIPLTLFYMTSVVTIYSAHEVLNAQKIVMPAVTNELFLIGLHIALALYLMRIIFRMAKLLLSYKGEGERDLLFGENRAGKAHRIIQAIALVSISGFIIHEISGILGLEEYPRILFSRVIGFVVLLMLISLVVRYRIDVSVWMKKDVEREESRLVSVREVMIFLADVWHIFAIAMMIVIYLTWLFNPETGPFYLFRSSLLTVAIILAARFASFAFDKVIRLIAESTEPSHVPMPRLTALLHMSIHVMAAALIFEVWGLNIFALFKTHAGEVIASRLLSIFVFVLAAIAIIEMANKLINDQLHPTRPKSKMFQPSDRVLTFLPLARNLVRWMVVIVTGIMILAECGLNVTMLLVGFSVVGLTIGMGAQRLVQDIITGIFILMENSIAVGDVVNIGGVSGEVQAFTTRTVVLRNISGEIHTVPYSAIGTVSNLSRDYTHCIVEISVGHDANLAHVTSVFEKTGAEMLTDAHVSPRVLTSLKVLGVSKITDTAVSITAIMKTEPDPYHFVDQEFRRRLKLKFAELGIPMPAVRQVLSFSHTRETDGALRVTVDHSARA